MLLVLTKLAVRTYRRHEAYALASGVARHLCRIDWSAVLRLQMSTSQKLTVDPTALASDAVLLNIWSMSRSIASTMLLREKKKRTFTRPDAAGRQRCSVLDLLFPRCPVPARRVTFLPPLGFLGESGLSDRL